LCETIIVVVYAMFICAHQKSTPHTIIHTQHLTKILFFLPMFFRSIKKTILCWLI